MRLHIAITWLLIPAFAPAARADEPPDTIRGKAFIAGADRPAARVTLRFLDRDAPGLTVTTDAAGRFRVALPAGLILPAISNGQTGPPCWMELQEAGRWTWEPIHHEPVQRADVARKLLDDVLMKSVRTTWRERGGLVYLEVECPPTGEVEVLVRGAGGGPLVDRPVQVIPVWGPFENQGWGTARFDGRIDGTGRFRMRWPEGMRRLRVVAGLTHQPRASRGYR
jgi:hypothetical protein